MEVSLAKWVLRRKLELSGVVKKRRKGHLPR